MCEAGQGAVQLGTVEVLGGVGRHAVDPHPSEDVSHERSRLDAAGHKGEQCRVCRSAKPEAACIDAQGRLGVGRRSKGTTKDAV